MKETIIEANWRDRVEARLRGIESEGRWRSPRVFDARGSAGVLDGGAERIVSFASNDYLGLTTHPAVVAAAQGALARWGAGSGASRLVTGTRPVHRDLEIALAEWKGTDSAITFSSGYAANLAVLSVFGQEGTTIFSDELNHASIVDGCRLARAETVVYRHADPEHLADCLAQYSGPTMVVTDTVFSMDGDIAPLGEIAAVCRKAGTLLVLDEAHAVLGPEPGLEVTDGLMVIRVGTLSKFLGSLGGFVAATRSAISLLENASRSYIFTTAPSPADTAAALAAVRIVRSREGEALRDRLARHVRQLASGARSPIVPVILGTEERALEASRALLEQGIWVPAIRPPTVPAGTARLRVTFAATHADAEVSQLCGALAAIASADVNE